MAQIRSFIQVLFFFLFLTGFSSPRHPGAFAHKNIDNSSNSGALVLLNRESTDYQKGIHFLIPYLGHFGIPYDTLHLSPYLEPDVSGNYSMYIFAHNGFATSRQVSQQLDGLLRYAMDNGIGVISFDKQFGIPSQTSDRLILTEHLEFSPKPHYITELHNTSQDFRLFGSLILHQSEYPGATTLIQAKSAPLLVISEQGNARVAIWTSQEWMHSDVLGPLGGLDDCLWRSMVWAAKKPFVMHSLPPIVTMRVDDVVGRGELFNESPFYWVKVAAEYGFKPWLGLFIYNMTPEAVDELRVYIEEGIATASPHAFGGPPRPGADHRSRGTYWYPEAIPLRADTYDEFIFFNHHYNIPWEDNEMKENLEAVDRWYEAHQPLPMSNYMLPHYYEIGSNAIDHVVQNWDIEFIGFPHGPDLSLHNGSCWLKSGPFRLYEEARPSMVTVPTYYADFVRIIGNELFNSLCEIRDDASYEWFPDNDVEATAARGIRQLKRSLDARAMAVLFTHETHSIYRISPENWKKEMELIAEGIESYNPMLMTMDEALLYQRARKTSAISSWKIDPDNNAIRVSLEGNTDVPTHFYLYTEKQGAIRSRIIEIPVFGNEIQISSGISSEGIE